MIILLSSFIVTGCKVYNRSVKIHGEYRLNNQIRIDTTSSNLEEVPFEIFSRLNNSSSTNLTGLLVITPKHIVTNIYFIKQPVLPTGSVLELVKDSLLSESMALEKLSSGFSYYASYQKKR